MEFTVKHVYRPVSKIHSKIREQMKWNKCIITFFRITIVISTLVLHAKYGGYKHMQIL